MLLLINSVKKLAINVHSIRLVHLCVERGARNLRYGHASHSFFEKQANVGWPGATIVSSLTNTHSIRFIPLWAERAEGVCNLPYGDIPLSVTVLSNDRLDAFDLLFSKRHMN